MWMIIVTVAASAVSFVAGWELSASRRRRLPIRGDALRLSQSTSSGRDGYRTYDITERELVLTEAAMAKLIISAIVRRPFKSHKLLSEQWASITRDCAGMWVYESHDSLGRPIYVTDVALAQMFLFYRGFMEPKLRDAIMEQFQAFPLFHAAIKMRDFCETLAW